MDPLLKSHETISSDACAEICRNPKEHVEGYLDGNFVSQGLGLADAGFDGQYLALILLLRGVRVNTTKDQNQS